jgi:hypothetical protein
MEEEKQKQDLDATVGSAESANAELVARIKNHTTVFLLIQTQSDSRWGLLSSLMRCMGNVCVELYCCQDSQYDNLVPRLFSF